MSRILIAIAASVLSCAAQGAPFPDPTQPPVMRDGSDTPVSPGLRVESILIAPDRRLAVVSG